MNLDFDITLTDSGFRVATANRPMAQGVIRVGNVILMLMREDESGPDLLRVEAYRADGSPIGDSVLFNAGRSEVAPAAPTPSTPMR